MNISINVTSCASFLSTKKKNDTLSLTHSRLKCHFSSALVIDANEATKKNNKQF